jgi:hypothetical protein
VTVPHHISESLFENWMDTFASRIGREQSPHAQVAYYDALCKIFDSDKDFHDAAQRVFEKHEWNTWPAPIEFDSARAVLKRVAEGNMLANLRRIDESRRLAPPPASASSHRAAVVDDFGRMWRDELTRKGADPASLDEERRASRRAVHGDDWLTDERRAACASDVVDSVEALQNADADQEGQAA